MEKQLKNQIKERILNSHADKIIFHKDGTIEARWVFFYRHGQTNEMYEQKIVKEFSFEKATIVREETFEMWNRYPADSYFKVTFRLPDNYLLSTKSAI